MKLTGAGPMPLQPTKNKKTNNNLIVFLGVVLLLSLCFNVYQRIVIDAWQNIAGLHEKNTTNCIAVLNDYNDLHSGLVGTKEINTDYKEINTDYKEINTDYKEINSAPYD